MSRFRVVSRLGVPFLLVTLLAAPALAHDWAGDVREVLAPPAPVAGYAAAAVTAGDLDGDGHGDLAVGASGTGKVYLYLGTDGGYPTEPALVLEAPAGAASFGDSLAPAGDVDGDGFDDLLVGAPGGSGHVYLYCGGPGGPSTSPCWEAAGTDPAGELGAAVAWGGDLDGDGYSDLLVGEPGWNGGTGRVLLFPGGAGGPAAAPAWSVQGTVPGERFGSALAGGIDVHGDGFLDVLVGAPAYSDDVSERGRALLFAGGPGGPAGAPSWEVRGESALDHLGQGVALPGDMDGDGIGDVAVGVPGRDRQGGPDVGAVLVFPGGSEGPAGEPAWRLGEDFAAGSRLGESLAVVGDVDGDGLADLAAGGPGSGDGAGSLVVIFGRADGPPLLREVPGDDEGLALGTSVGSGGDPDGDGFVEVVGCAPGTGGDDARVYVAAGARRKLTTADPDWIRFGGQYRAQYGTVVWSAGDVNGDGYDDLLVGDYMWDEGNLQDAGKVDLFMGGPGGLPEDPAWTFTGSQAGAQAGIATAGAGDVNGDGYDDVLVSVWREQVVYRDEGRVYLFYGGPDGLAEEARWSVAGGQSGAQLGLSVAGAGDLNGDGFADFVVTSPNYRNDAGGEGRVLVFLGGPDGPGSEPDWTWDPTWTGTWFGTMAGRAGDVNGDGYDDLFVTDMEYSDGESTEGLVLVFHGGPDGLPDEPSWSFEEDRDFVCLGYSAAGAGDVNGDGYEDLIVSGAGEWTIHPLPEQQVVHVFLGSPDGLEPEPSWTRYGYERDGDYGSDVSGVGDVNGDGYGDILIGSDTYHGRGIAEEGRLDLHLGGPSGPADEPAWVRYGGQARANLGVWCRPAGDVDGDGVVDIAAGAQYLEDDVEEEGAAMVFLGNRGGPLARPGQKDPAEDLRVPVLAHVRSLDSYRVEMTFGEPLASTRFRMEAETRPAVGEGETTTRLSSWEAPGQDSRVTRELTFTGLEQGTRYTWRARVQYEDSPFQDHGPWFDRVGTGPGLAKLGTDRDADGDGVGALSDCDDGDGDVWSTPGEARELRFRDRDTLTWEPPLDAGGDPAGLLYDTLRSDSPSDFGQAVYVERDGDDLESADEEVPPAGDAFSYLVRAKNGCGCGSLGKDSTGNERVQGGCP